MTSDECKAKIPMSATVILAVSNEPGLLESRSSILRSDGYVVEPVLSVEQAIDRLLNRDFDLVLLGHSIPAHDRTRLTRLIRASGLPTAVVTVAPLIDPVPYEAADAIVEGSPEMLLSGIREILLKAGKDGNGGETTYPIQSTADYLMDTAPIPRVVQAPSCGSPPTARDTPVLDQNRDRGHPL